MNGKTKRLVRGSRKMRKESKSEQEAERPGGKGGFEMRLQLRQKINIS